MNATEYFRAGKLNEAITALNQEVRDDPGNVRQRTFLFELLCFAGEFDRAEKQLDVLAQGGRNFEMGGLVYRAALHAERERQRFFQSKEYLQHTTPAQPRSGELNGTPFQSLLDADPRIGTRLEVFVAGNYMWVPFEHIESIEMQPPKRLRDQLWAPVILRTGEGFPIRDLGEVMVPVLSPSSARHADDQVRLGRLSVWEGDEEGNEVPFGQKLLLMDGEEFSLLDLRKLQFATTAAAAS